MLLFLQLKHLPVDMVVPFQGAISVTSILTDPVMTCNATTMEKRNTQIVSTSRKSNQPIRPLELEFVKPAMPVVKPGITIGIAQK